MDESVVAEPRDVYEQVGLKKETVGGVKVYVLEFTKSSPSEETLKNLRDLLNPHRVSVELGPGDQLDSLIFATHKAQASTVIGIDPNFDFPNFKSLDNPPEVLPKIILFKGDGWGDRRIIEFFGAGPRSQRLAVYSQIVAPESEKAEAMIQAARSKSRERFMAVLDSGTVELLRTWHYSPGQIQRHMLSEQGIEDPSHLDWIKYLLRDLRQETLSRQEYGQGVVEGKYPPSAHLREGEMMVFEHQEE